MVGLAGALALTMNAASGAANPTPVVAGPLAALTNYATPRVVLLKGRTLNFRNLDIAPHNVVSPNGLFSSALIGLNRTTPVFGVDRLAKGTYPFICTLHAKMKGQLLVR